MAVPLEQKLLADASERLGDVLGEARSDHTHRLEVLEGCSALVGGFSLDAYRDLEGSEHALLSAEQATGAAEVVLPAIVDSGVPPALALSALSRPPLDRWQMRATGAYYTDFRLAELVARGIGDALPAGGRVIDPASGTGALLVAIGLQLPNQPAVDEFIRHAACAADLDFMALRGVRLSLAALTSDLPAVASLAARLRNVDSLVAGFDSWSDVAPNGFDLVVGNPPWEKLKLTRHEHLLSQGARRHYGADYENEDLSDLEVERRRLRTYAETVGGAYDLHGGGEIDLYRLFLALAIDLTRGSGQIAMLVPAGLIRSEGTFDLRRHLFEQTSALRIAISDNKARHFGIDSRFKFLVVHATMRDGRSGKRLTLQHLRSDDHQTEVVASAEVDRGRLKRLRPDLTVPEVRSQAEWTLFEKMHEAGPPLGSDESAWPFRIVRELDMTRERDRFSRKAGPAAAPLVEGRMVHQFRHAAKTFLSGSGRSAAWAVQDVGSRELKPQFWISRQRLPESLRVRIEHERIGFCDITGQTNERTMLAARIPAGMVCNNKVPTIHMNDGVELSQRGWLWLGLANSFAFDWLLRRVITTTVNFFILRSVALPAITDEILVRRITDLAQRISDSYQGAEQADASAIAHWRADLDALAMRAYGLGMADARLIFEDFPLLDRGQPPLPTEGRSTVTRDLVLAALVEQARGDSTKWRSRADQAIALGAVAYVPAELARQRARVAA